MKQFLSLENLSCQHCVNKVSEKLSELDGVCQVDVNLEKNIATVTTSQTYSQEDYQKSLAKTIYKVIEIF